jgi:putative selenate reductase
VAELHPSSLSVLLFRALHEWESRRSIFDLKEQSFWRASEARDLSVQFHGERAENAAGPAAGPQSQLIQNIVLSWLAGGRVIELKTVQVDDHLEIPRPCIDARTLGYNIEWSQELRVEQSLTEYVGAWMALGILNEELQLGEMPLFDMSVGYDLAGIKTDKVKRFIRGMMDARATIESLKKTLTGPLAKYRDLDFSPKIASCITLSTFHGCPPGEIEAICEFLLKEMGTHVVIKMNPTQLGFEDVQKTVNEDLGYKHVVLDKSAFDHDLQWPEAQQLVERLGSLADSRGLTLGVKYSNTLVVENQDDFFSLPTMYLSGAALHVLAIRLASRFRDRFQNRFGISFSAGIERANFSDAVLSGLAPVTSCTDLLRAGGYGRMKGYLNSLNQRLTALGAQTVEEGILGNGLDQGVVFSDGALSKAQQDALAAAWQNRGALAVSEVLESVGLSDKLSTLSEQSSAHHLRCYAKQVTADPRYHYSKNSKAPRKIGKTLKLFDCINCDKCIGVCPNNANFALDTEGFLREECPILAVGENGVVNLEKSERYQVVEQHQIANYADFCNECGNCDVFCPEDGGPYIVKPRFFKDRSTFLESPTLDGFWFQRDDHQLIMEGRMSGRVHRLIEQDGRPDIFDDGDISCEIAPDTGDVLGQRAFFKAKPGHELPLWRYHAMKLLRRGVLGDGGANPVSAHVFAKGFLS